MSHDALHGYAEVAARAALKAGSFLARSLGRAGMVRTKRSAIDLVTEVDRASERLIQTALWRADPRFGFLGEEHGEQRHGAPYRWVVDPLDGTTNFVHGVPIFGVSIALQRLGAPAPSQGGGPILVGVIYDPMRRELFVATKGGGAFLNGKRIRVSPTRTLRHSLLSTGFSSKFLRRDEPYLGWFRVLQRHSHGVRRVGSTVWCLAAVAAGRLEAFYERDLWPWDMAAGMLLVEEAGGRVTDLDGGPAALGRGQLAASNGRIHRELLARLRTSARGR